MARLFHVNLKSETVKKLMNMHGVLTSEDLENHLAKTEINIPVIKLEDYKDEVKLIIRVENKRANHWIALWNKIMFDSTGRKPNS